MIWLKRFIFTIWLSKGVAYFQGLFGKMNYLKIKHLKKIHFFLVSEYGNLTGVKTHHDRLWNSGESILEQRVHIFGFGKGRGPRRGFGCCPIIALHSFIGSAHEVSKHFFLRSRPPFRVFTLESHFFFFIFFSFSIVLLCT